MIIQVVVRRPWEDISGFYSWIQDNSSSHLCGQHDADEDTKTTHCHIMCNTTINPETIRLQAIKHGVGGRGVAAVLKQCAKKKIPYDETKLCIYITKGDVNNIKRSSFDVDTINYFASQWVQHEPTSKSPDDKKDHFALIEHILEESTKIPGAWESVLARDSEGIIVSERGLTYEGRRKIFQLMVNTLNKNRVRTSRNELERFYVTLIRHDYHSVECLQDSILRNVYREVN